VVAIGFVLVKNNAASEQQVTASETKKPSQILYNRVNYVDYSDQALSTARTYGRTLLFFAATTWCSNCKVIDEEIKKRNTELPTDITILKVDYDHDNKMKAKYGVTMQTTLILLDNNGNEIKRWIGTDFDDVIDNLQ